jgi:hypothetical protein
MQQSNRRSVRLVASTVLVLQSCCAAHDSPNGPRSAVPSVPVSDACLRPEDGAYSPLLDWNRAQAERGVLSLGFEYSTQVQVVIRAAPAAQRLILVETKDRRYFLNLLSAEVGGNNGSASAANGVAGKAADVGVPIRAEFATAMRTLWVAALSQSRYPSHTGTATARVDGVSYHFWGKSKNTGALAGYAHSPRSGSYLDELCRLVDSLVQFVRFKQTDPERLEEWMKALTDRAQRNDMCAGTSS